MGELEKEMGAWGYVEGGMGGVSNSVANSARSLGADIFTEQVRILSQSLFSFLVLCRLCGRMLKPLLYF